MPVTSRDAQAGLSPAARRSIIGGILSLLIDSYDIYVPAFILPAALNYFEPSTMAATTKVTLVSVIFTVTLLARPVGGPIFGHLGDKIGRKRVTMICGAGFTVTTLVIACLPGYSTWGYGALVALIVLRFIDGVFLGGGYAGPVPLAIERSPSRLRGLVGGVVVRRRARRDHLHQRRAAHRAQADRAACVRVLGLAAPVLLRRPARHRLPGVLLARTRGGRRGARKGQAVAAGAAA